jgi:hypothetical protein
VAEPVAKRICFEDRPTLWLWLHDDPEHLSVVFLEGDEPNVWHVGLYVLDGEESAGMRITLSGRHADLILDGVGQDDDDRIVLLRGDAQALKDFAVDIQVARSSRAFQDELRGLIDG